MTIAKFKPPAIRFPGLSVMDRYIFIEILTPFLFGMGLFTTLGISIGILFDLVRRVTESGLLLQAAMQVFILKIPEFIVLAFPMSMLLATLMAYSRLSSDSELIALRSIGVSILRILIPAIIFSLIVTAITFVFNDFVAPVANHQASITLEKALERQRPSFTERNIIYPEYKRVTRPDGKRRTELHRIFYAEEFDGQSMRGLTILDLSQEGINQIINAKSAKWNIADNIWDFFDGTIYLIAPDGSYRNIVRFEHQQIAIARTPLDIVTQERDYDEMNVFQAQEYLQILRLSGNERKIRKLEVRIQEKFAFPFVCLVFALIGSSLGLRPQNTGRATSFGICVILIFSYYLFAFLCSSMGVWGVLSPFMAAWLPNILGLLAGSFLVYKSSV